jgi:hypothetical protein
MHISSIDKLYEILMRKKAHFCKSNGHLVNIYFVSLGRKRFFGGIEIVHINSFPNIFHINSVWMIKY